MGPTYSEPTLTRIYIKLFIQRPVFEPDVLTQIAFYQNTFKSTSISKKEKKKKKKKQGVKLTCTELERDYTEMVFQNK